MPSRITMLAIGLTLLAGLLVGMGNRLPKLDSQVVVHWSEEGCPEGMELRTYYNTGGGWTPIKLRNENVIEPGDCVAHALLNPQFMACCTTLEGGCVLAEGGADPTSCNRIFSLLTGRQYGPNKVAAWNEQHATFRKVWQFGLCGCGDSMEVGIWDDDLAEFVVQEPAPLPGNQWVQTDEALDPTDTALWRIRCYQDGLARPWFSWEAILAAKERREAQGLQCPDEAQ